MYFGTQGGRVYKNSIAEAFRLGGVFGEYPRDIIEWPLPDYWPVMPALDMWRLR